jgi:hypothetical protein
MNPEAEALVRAYEAYLENGESEARWDAFLAEVRQHAERSGISEDSIIRAVRTWALRQQRASDKKPPTIPPAA